MTQQTSSRFFTLGRKVALFAATAGVLGFLYAASASRSSQATEDAFTPAQKEALGAYIDQYLVAHPDIIVKALEAYQGRQEAAEQQMFLQRLAEYKDALGKDAPFAGNPEGDITVVEFFDYNCGYCRKAVEDIVKLLETDKNLKIVFREMPILSPASQDAARWALAADKQGKYYEYHVALMKSSMGAKSVKGLEDVAKELGLDVEKLRADADSKEIRAAIENNLSMARNLGIRGTPGFVIGDRLSPGYMGYDAMKAVIDQARGQGAAP